MRTISVDSKKKCHPSNDGTMTEIQTDFFDGKCDIFVEGHCCDITESYVSIYPQEHLTELECAQAQYERMMAEAEAAYREGVNSVD